MGVIVRMSADEAFKSFKNAGANIRSQVFALNEKSKVGAINIDEVDRTVGLIVSAIPQMEGYLATTEISAWAAKQHPEKVGYDVDAEFVIFKAACVSVVSWVNINVPKGAGGYELTYTRQPDGSKIPRAFDSDTAAPLRVELQKVIDATET